MKDPARVRERYMRDPLSVRLAGLAATLNRVSSSVRHATGGASVEELLDESQRFIEWTAAETEPEIAEELVNLQVMLGLWPRAWPGAQQSPSQRIILSVQAKIWADQVRRYSGIGQ